MCVCVCVRVRVRLRMCMYVHMRVHTGINLACSLCDVQANSRLHAHQAGFTSYDSKC